MKFQKLLRSGILAKISYMFGIALILASVLMNVIPPKDVSACAQEIFVKLNGTPNCLTDGKRTIKWVVQNDWNLVGTITEIHVYDDEVEISGWSIDGFGVGTTIAAYSGGVGSVSDRKSTRLNSSHRT